MNAFISFRYNKSCYNLTLTAKQGITLQDNLSIRLSREGEGEK